MDVNLAVSQVLGVRPKEKKKKAFYSWNEELDL